MRVWGSAMEGLGPQEGHLASSSRLPAIGCIKLVHLRRLAVNPSVQPRLGRRLSWDAEVSPSLVPGTDAMAPALGSLQRHGCTVLVCRLSEGRFHPCHSPHLRKWGMPLAGAKALHLWEPYSLLGRWWAGRAAAAPGILYSQLALAFFPARIALLYFCNY